MRGVAICVSNDEIDHVNFRYLKHANVYIEDRSSDENVLLNWITFVIVMWRHTLMRSSTYNCNLTNKKYIAVKHRVIIVSHENVLDYEMLIQARYGIPDKL